MSRYEVDAAELARAAGGVQTRVASIQAEVAAMNRQLTELQAGWRGAAAGAFAGLLADWSSTQSKVEQSLSQISAAMTTASRTYAEAEAAASRLFAAG